MNGRPYTAADVAMLRRLYPDTQTEALAKAMGRTVDSVYIAAIKRGIRKSAEYLKNLGSDLSRHSAATRFQTGHVPANKGLRRPGFAPGRMRETQFKPGQVLPRWDPEIYIVGALRINSDGILEIKVAPGARQWVILARYTWATERGPIPRGHIVHVKGDDPYDAANIDNLELLTRAENLRRNSIKRYPPKLRSAIVALGQFKRRIREKQDRRSAQPSL